MQAQRLLILRKLAIVDLAFNFDIVLFLNLQMISTAGEFNINFAKGELR